MSDAHISDAGVALMCDIARASLIDPDGDKRVVLDGLIADGLVRQAAKSDTRDGVTLVVTPKGQALLDARGVGVNES